MSLTHLTPRTQDAFGDKTRGKILKQSLALFNQYGYDRVTTAKIAKVTSILEGTLWYHFNTKQALVLDHLAAFEACMEALLQRPVSDSIPHILQHFEDVLFVLWDFRYLFSDRLHQIMHDTADPYRLQDMYLKLETMAEERLRQADSVGLLDLASADIEKLSTSMIMIGRYWIDYVQIRDMKLSTPSEIRDEGMAQLLSLLHPYFTARAIAFRASRNP